MDPTDDARTGEPDAPDTATDTATSAASSPTAEPTADPDLDATPWLAWPVGAKVMVRRRLADGGYADTVGVLVARDAARLVLHGRRGEVVVPAAEVAIGKVVPPPVLGPRRRG